jgi:hypothetical protein
MDSRLVEGHPTRCAVPITTGDKEQILHKSRNGGGPVPTFALSLRNYPIDFMAGATGLEPATFGVTGRIKSNGINGGCNIFFA